MNAIELAVLIQRCDKFAQVIIGFGEIHRFFVYAFLPSLASTVIEHGLQSRRRSVTIDIFGMALKIFNSLGGDQEEFVGVKTGGVEMYVCRLTVLDSSLVGHW